MIEFTETEVMNIHGAIRGARNSWESHHKADSEWVYDIDENEYEYAIGPNDHALLMKLSKAGSSHAKYLRQIFVCVDIDAPLYWWKEMDQHKIAVVTNSESTMHTLDRQSITDNELYSLDVPEGLEDDVDSILEVCEHLRQMYKTTKDRKYWKLLIQLLPSGWMQKRTTTLNYANLVGIYHDRKNHRLTEWHDMCAWIESLPYSELITGKVAE